MRSGPSLLVSSTHSSFFFSFPFISYFRSFLSHLFASSCCLSLFLSTCLCEIFLLLLHVFSRCLLTCGILSKVSVCLNRCLYMYVFVCMYASVYKCVYRCVCGCVLHYCVDLHNNHQSWLAFWNRVNLLKDRRHKLLPSLWSYAQLFNMIKAGDYERRKTCWRRQHGKYPLCAPRPWVSRATCSTSAPRHFLKPVLFPVLFFLRRNQHLEAKLLFPFYFRAMQRL